MTGTTFFALSGLLAGLLGVGYLAKTLGDEVFAANRDNKKSFDRINERLERYAIAIVLTQERLGKLEKPTVSNEDEDYVMDVNTRRCAEEMAREREPPGELYPDGRPIDRDAGDLPEDSSQITSASTSPELIRAGEKAMAEAKREQNGEGTDG